MMYSYREKMRGNICNNDGVIILWVKKKPIFYKPARRWRDDVASSLLLDSSFMYL